MYQTGGALVQSHSKLLLHPVAAAFAAEASEKTSAAAATKLHLLPRNPLLHLLLPGSAATLVNSCPDFDSCSITLLKVAVIIEC
jgi:hypothetical protein